MHIVSSFSQALIKKNFEGKRGLSHNIIANLGLKIIPNSQNLKTSQFFLRMSISLGNQTDLVLLHNEIDTITEHGFNDFKHCDPDDL